MSRKGAVSVLLRIVAMLNLNDRFAANPLHFAAAYAIVLVLLDLLQIGSNYLELQTRASRVQNQTHSWRRLSVYQARLAPR